MAIDTPHAVCCHSPGAWCSLCGWHPPLPLALAWARPNHSSSRTPGPAMFCETFPLSLVETSEETLTVNLAAYLGLTCNRKALGRACPSYSHRSKVRSYELPALCPLKLSHLLFSEKPALQSALLSNSILWAFIIQCFCHICKRWAIYMIFIFIFWHFILLRRSLRPSWMSIFENDLLFHLDSQRNLCS